MSATELITWKTSHSKYTQYEVGYIGKVAVFYVGYDGLASKSDNCKWKLSWKLPIRCRYRHEVATSFYFEEIKEAKIYADTVMREWFDLTGTRYDE